MNAEEYLDGWTSFSRYLISDLGRYGRTYALTLTESAIYNAIQRGGSSGDGFYEGWEDAALASLGLEF